MKSTRFLMGFVSALLGGGALLTACFAEAAPVQMINNLYVNNFQITEQNGAVMSTTLQSGKDYKLLINIKNKNDNDTYWYDNVQLRVVPMKPEVKFYTTCSYTATMPRFGSPLFKLKSKDERGFSICFRWTGASTSVSSVLFDTGIYAQEIPILNGWHKISSPQ